MKWIKDNGWIGVIILGCFLIVATIIVDLYYALNGHNISMVLSWGCCMIGVATIYLGALIGMSRNVMF